MTLGQKQRVFARLVARLIEHAYLIGYEITLGEAYRTPTQAAANAAAGTGISNSLHIQRLAIDLNLFKDGIYLTDSARADPHHFRLADAQGAVRYRSARPDRGCRGRRGAGNQGRMAVRRIV